MFQGKRPKYEVMFYQRKQNQLKEQLAQEVQDYESTMVKMKVEVDKKIERFQAQTSRRLSFSSQFSNRSKQLSQGRASHINKDLTPRDTLGNSLNFAFHRQGRPPEPGLQTLSPDG